MAKAHVGPWTPLGVAMAEARRLYAAHDGIRLPLEVHDTPATGKPQPPAIPGQLCLALEA